MSESSELLITVSEYLYELWISSASTIKEKFWISFRKLNEINDISKTFEIIFIKQNGSIKFESELNIEPIAKGIKVAHNNKEYIVQLPNTIYHLNEKNLVNFDITNDEKASILGTNDGFNFIYSLVSQNIDKKWLSSFNDFNVEISRFFPNDKVLITAGFDYLIKLWDLHDLSLPIRTFQHHQLVKGISFLDSGRNFLSWDSKSINLWECGSGEKVKEIFYGVENLEVYQDDELLSDYKNKENSLEFNTKGKVLVFESNNSLIKWDLFLNLRIFEKKIDFKVKYLKKVDNNLILNDNDGNFLVTDFKTFEIINKFSINKGAKLKFMESYQKDLVLIFEDDSILQIHNNRIIKTYLSLGKIQNAIIKNNELFTLQENDLIIYNL